MMLRTHFGLNEFVKIVNFIAGHGIKVLNGSFAYNAAHSTLKALVDAADRLDILMVFAASNENCDNDNLPTRGCDGYPATFNNRNVMSVCASDYYGDKAYFSSYGKTTVDVCAPGHKVLTTADPKRVASGYSSPSGTSFSSPMVAGLAGLIRAAYPAFTAGEVKEIIIETCKQTAALRNYSVCGGQVDATAAMNHASSIAKQKGIAAAMMKDGETQTQTDTGLDASLQQPEAARQPREGL
eukprot:GHVU01002891.1.p1 GENE.GHVU01002891.1~~GHVU01002891.1.p1  ORF type:complete len:240 (+),score=37.42 GHVU01002891.1:1164-1883(+)